MGCFGGSDHVGESSKEKTEEEEKKERRENSCWVWVERKEKRRFIVYFET